MVTPLLMLTHESSHPLLPAPWLLSLGPASRVHIRAVDTAPIPPQRHTAQSARNRHHIAGTGAYLLVFYVLWQHILCIILFAYQ